MTQLETQNSSRTTVKVSRNDLPLSCPRVSEGVAELHPRVYLPIEKTGTATCPYCGARYQLSD
jgi:uncharacterized Zn-finger protein